MGFLLRKQFEFDTVLAIEPGLEQLHLTARLGRAGSLSQCSCGQFACAGVRAPL